MHRIYIQSCKPGMRLGKPIFNETGKMLLGIGVELTEELISKLYYAGVDSLFIDDELTSDIVIEEPVSAKTVQLTLTTLKKTFQDAFNNKFMQSLAKSNFLQEYRKIMEALLSDLTNNKSALLMLHKIFVKDSYLYTHSLNVAIYTITLGIAKGYNYKELYELGLGALLHDIGKTQIPQGILNKPGPLTEEEFSEMKKHPDYGFEMMRQVSGFPLLAAHILYQHHEHCDGSGYPRGITGDKIHDFAKIVAVADTYDSLTSERVYRKKILPHEALEYLYIQAGKLYNKKIIELFRDNIAIYPIGVTVTLNNGYQGVVIDINNKFPARPILRIISDEDGNRIDKTFEIDLSKELGYIISKCSC